MQSMQTRPSRTPEEGIGYAVAHRVRVEVLAALNEGSYSTQELARIVHQPLSTVTHHVEELLKANRIEVAFTKKVRAMTQSFYRAVEMPFFTEEEMASWSFEKRQEIYSLILQSSTLRSWPRFGRERSVTIPSRGLLGAGSTWMNGADATSWKSN